MKKIYLPIGLICIAIAACKKTETDTGTSCKFITNVQPIINTKCSITNCHGTGSTLADFTVYANLKERADNGRIRTNVFDLKIMPPASASPLTDQEKEILKCWLDNGAPQD